MPILTVFLVGVVYRSKFGKSSDVHCPLVSSDGGSVSNKKGKKCLIFNTSPKPQVSIICYA